VSGKLSLTLLHAFFTNPGATTTVVGPSTSNLPVASGNILPGVAEKYAYAELAWDPLPGLSSAVEFSARGRMFVEDSNTQMPAPGYAIASWRLQLHQEASGWRLKEFVRVDNLFDRTYVGSVIVGDVFGRYYEPAPGRNGLMGINASYQF
jgi:iron complex outermembrane receptor protein